MIPELSNAFKPAIDAILTIAPPPNSASFGAPYNRPLYTPVRLTDTVCSHPFLPPIPALFTNIFNPPNSLIALLSALSTSSSLVTSNSKAEAWPPLSEINADVSSAAFPFISVHITAAPSADILIAIARPKPEPAPVMKAIRPSKRSSIFLPLRKNHIGHDPI